MKRVPFHHLLLVNHKLGKRQMVLRRDRAHFGLESFHFRSAYGRQLCPMSLQARDPPAKIVDHGMAIVIHVCHARPLLGCMGLDRHGECVGAFSGQKDKGADGCDTLHGGTPGNLPAHLSLKLLNDQGRKQLLGYLIFSGTSG
jgi:hypothetical protein